MGAWGTGNFDNDDAADWLCVVAESRGVGVLLSPLAVVISEPVYLEAPECSQALAASEIIAQALARDTRPLPEAIQRWLARKPGLFGKRPRIEVQHGAVAMKAVQRIIADSELKTLWQDTEEYPQWNALQQGLLERLAKVAY